MSEQTMEWPTEPTGHCASCGAPVGKQGIFCSHECWSTFRERTMKQTRDRGPEGPTAQAQREKRDKGWDETVGRMVENLQLAEVERQDRLREIAAQSLQTFLSMGFAPDLAAKQAYNSARELLTLIEEDERGGS